MSGAVGDGEPIAAGCSWTAGAEMAVVHAAMDATAIATATEEALRRRDELVPLGATHAASFTARATGEAFLAAYADAAARL